MNSPTNKSSGNLGVSSAILNDGKAILAGVNLTAAAADVTITIYEASPSDIDTNLKTFTQVDLLRNDRLIATSLNLRASAAVSLVAIAESALVDVTIAGYYVND